MVLRPIVLDADSGPHPDALPRGSATGRRVFCVGHVMAYPPRAGNEYRIHRLLRWLALEGSDLLVVLCPLPDAMPTERQLAETAAIYPNLIVCTHDGIVWHRLAEGAASLDGFRAPASLDLRARLGERCEEDPAKARMLALQRAFCPDVLVALLHHLDRTFRPDILLAEYVFMTRAFALLRPDLIKIVDTIDVFSTKAAKVDQRGVSDGLAMSEAEESVLLRRADVLIGIQPEEAALLERLSPSSEVVSVGVDFAMPDVPTGIPGRPIALMVASNNPMNVKGLNDFLRFAWPAVRQIVPDAQLRVVGAVGDGIRQPPEGIHILGCLERLDAEYAGARAVINPAAAGTGLKVKTVEALSHLRPVVVWPAGVDGIADGARAFCLVAADWPEFARHLVQCLTDTALLAGIANHRSALSEAFSADVVYAPLRDILARARPAARSAGCG